MASRRNWIREEVWAALFLYLKTEFGHIHIRNPEIIALGVQLGRTPGAVALKMSNLAALHDRAFDRHLISFDQDYKMLVSKRLPDRARAKLENIAGVALCMPDKFLPGQDYLERHRRQFFDAQSC